MGYCTYFTDETEPSMTEEQFAKLEAIVGFRPDFDDGMKWYEYKENMAQLSIYFPETLFVLHGNAEDDDDFWRGYWQNGKQFIAKAEIVYPKFDLSAMAKICDPLPPKPTTPQFVVNGSTIDFDF